MLVRSTGSVLADAGRVADAEVRVAKAHVMAHLLGTTPRERLGRYELHARIGEGAHGCVYRAFDPRLRREVAIKVLRPGCADVTWQLRQARAHAEAHGLARLQHPGVVAVYDVGVRAQASGERSLYIVMELVDGPDLEGWLRGRQRAWPEILKVGLAAGRGLAAAHRVGLVHRDVKPGNMLVGPGGAGKIADFGLVGRIARAPSTARSPGDREPDARLTATGHVLGTPLYMAPEQHEGDAVDARADQYAFCVALWEALHGAPPFVGSTSVAVHADKLRGPPNRGARSNVPVALCRVLARGMQVAPGKRHRDMDALVEALEDAGRGKGTRRATLGAVLGVGSIALAAHAWPAAPAPCEEQPARWPAEGGDAIEVAFVATGRSDARERADRVGRELDAWHARFGEASHAACRQASAPHTAACLAGAWEERTALLSILEEADARVVGRAATAIARLPAPEDCVGDGVRVRSPGASADHASLARVRALQAAGREHDAWQLAHEVLQRQKPGDPLWLEAAFRVGRLELLTGHGPAAATLERVHHEALAAGDPRMAAAAGAQLLQIHARADERSIAARWDRHTEAALRRAGDPDDVRLVWLHGRGILAQKAGRATDAIAAYGEAVAVAERIGATDQAATSLGMRGLARRDLGELAAAEADLREALRVREDMIGADDVRLHATLQNLGSVLVASGAHVEARAVLERARDLVVRHQGPDAPEAIDITELLGLAAYEEDDLSRASTLLSEVLAARERNPSATPRQRAHACFNLANVQAVRGDLVAAARHHAAAIRWLEEAVGPEHPEVAYVLLALADVEREQGDLASSRQHLARADAVLEHAQVPASRRAELAEIRAKVETTEDGPS